MCVYNTCVMNVDDTVDELLYRWNNKVVKFSMKFSMKFSNHVHNIIENNMNRNIISRI